VNAYQKKLDAWLIYKCRGCDRTWNCTIFSRVDARRVDRCLLQRLQANDKVTAWSYAFDYALRRRNGVELDPALAYTIAGEELRQHSYGQGRVSVLLTAELPLPVRIDALLAKSSNYRVPRCMRSSPAAAHRSTLPTGAGYRTN
jgi:hypothetical protein